MNIIIRHNSVRSFNAENVNNFPAKCNPRKFSEIISRTCRILHQQFLKRSQLEKKLILCLVVGATCFVVVTLLIIYFSSLYETDICTKPGCIISAARLLEGMNMSIDPCDNFYEYVCGRWSQAHMNPDEPTSWFTDRTKFINYRIKNILEESSDASDIKPVLQMKEFYRLCTDTGSLNKYGMQPVFQILDTLGLPRVIPNKDTAKDLKLAKTLSLAQRWLNFDILIQLSTLFNNTLNTTLLSVSPASNELSFLTDEIKIAMKSKYTPKLTPDEFLVHQISYMTAVMVEFSNGIFSLDDITREALKIILLEAQLKLSIQEGDKDNEQYMTINELQDLMFSNVTAVNLSAFNWQDYIIILVDGLNVSLNMNSLVRVTNPQYFQALGTHLVNLKPINFQRLIWWKIIDALVPHTTDVMRMHEYMFNQYVLRGIALPPTRSSVCIALTKSVFNDAIAHKLSLQQNLSEVSKNVNNIMTNIKEVFKRLISNSEWIDHETKNISILKVDSVKTFIGYSEQLLDPDWIVERYKKVTLVENDFIGSLLIVRSALVNEILNTIHTSHEQKVDNQNWSVDPTEVNAYYSRDINSIAIPSGILQYPFYIDGIQALNYGAIGSILGHELTHGFDSEGKNYDWNGERRLTWNENMTSAFINRAECYVDQYSKYNVTENTMVNGSATLAENIADNGGIKEAFHAYEEYISKNGIENQLPGFEKFSHQQLLFISFANVWCKQQTKISLKFSILDEHSPNKYRVIGSLSNLREFSRTWNCKLNSPMNPANKCLLW